MLKRIDTVFVRALKEMVKRAPDSDDLVLKVGDVVPCAFESADGKLWTSADIDAAKIFDPAKDPIEVLPGSPELVKLENEQVERRNAEWRRRMGW